MGYRGILCASCEDGYEKQRGTRKKSLTKSSSRFYIACAGFWSLILLATTIRSARISLSEMDQMTAFLEQAANVQQGAVIETRESAPRTSSLPGAGSSSRRGIAAAVKGDQLKTGRCQVSRVQKRRG